MFTRRAFTLVELMIVVAIIGILAAIAVPNFVAMQYRAKRAEVPSNLQSMKTAELAYDAAHDMFVEQGTPVPSDLVYGADDKVPRPWITGTGFETMTWSPDGDVRGAYSVTTSAAGSDGSADFVVTGSINVDGDGTQARFTCSKETNAKMGTANDIY